MNSLFQELKQAREAKQFTLNDVSDATLINIKFLEAIEQGNTNILPQTYVRAFIREYASFVGLDPVEIMKRYDQQRQEEVSPAIPEPDHTPEPTPPREESRTVEEEHHLEGESRPPIAQKFALPTILVLALAIIIWNLTRTSTPPETRDIESIDQQSIPVTDSAAQQHLDRSGQTLPPADSLTLHASILDSSWVQIIIDNQQPQEYLFRPNRKISWKARDQFRITVGNAGAVDLTLNQKRVGTLGKRGAVRSLELNRQSLLKK